MKRPLAYLTAAWSGEPDIDTLLGHTEPGRKQEKER